MSESPTPDNPKPVVPLDYFENAPAAQRAIVRALAWITAITSLIDAGLFLVYWIDLRQRPGTIAPQFPMISFVAGWAGFGIDCFGVVSGALLITRSRQGEGLFRAWSYARLTFAFAFIVMDAGEFRSLVIGQHLIPVSIYLSELIHNVVNMSLLPVIALVLLRRRT